MSGTVRLLCACGYSPQAQQVAAGIEAYIDEHRLDWQAVTMIDKAIEREIADPHSHRHWQAVLGFLKPKSLGAWARRHGLASATCTSPGSQALPAVLPDDHSIAERALDHLLDTGYRQLGIIPNHRRPWQPRYHAFAEACRTRGLTCHIHRRRHHGAEAEEDMVAWMRAIPGPLALFVPQDRGASALRDLCRRHGVAVPREVALLGVDDDERLCTLATPHLSSVMIPWHDIGRRLALCVHRQLGAARTTATTIHVPVYRVQARASTRRPPHADPLVEAALGWIESHLDHPRAAAELARVLQVHPATLCRRLRRGTGATAKDHLARRRRELAHRLLDEGLSTTAVARRCGLTTRQGLRALLDRR